MQHRLDEYMDDRKKKVKCPYCGKYFTKRGLRVHIARAHGLEEKINNPSSIYPDERVEVRWYGQHVYILIKMRKSLATFGLKNSNSPLQYL